MFILTASTLPNWVNGKIHLAKSFFISVINFPEFAINSRVVIRVLTILRYTNPFSAYLKLNLFLSSTGQSPKSIIAIDSALFVKKYHDISPYYFRLLHSTHIGVDASQTETIVLYASIILNSFYILMLSY